MQKEPLKKDPSTLTRRKNPGGISVYVTGSKRPREEEIPMKIEDEVTPLTR